MIWMGIVEDLRGFEGGGLCGSKEREGEENR